MNDESKEARDDLAQAVWQMEKLSRNTPRIDRLRWIVHHKSAARMEGFMMDLFTASMLVQVCDVLNEKNREKFLALRLGSMVDVGWKLVNN